MMIIKAQESQVIELLLRSYLLNLWVDVYEISLNIHCNYPGTMKKKVWNLRSRIRRSSHALPSSNVLAKTVGNMMRNWMPGWTPVSSPLFVPVRIAEASPPFLINTIRKGIALKAHMLLVEIKGRNNSLVVFSKVKKSLVQSFQDCDQMYRKICKCIFDKDLLVGLGLHISRFYHLHGEILILLLWTSYFISVSFLPGVTDIDRCTQQTAPSQPEYERELAVQTSGLFPSNQTVTLTWELHSLIL